MDADKPIKFGVESVQDAGPAPTVDPFKREIAFHDIRDECEASTRHARAQRLAQTAKALPEVREVIEELEKTKADLAALTASLSDEEFLAAQIKKVRAARK
jgi:hypothetical protein